MTLQLIDIIHSVTRLLGLKESRTSWMTGGTEGRARCESGVINITGLPV